MEWTQQGVHYTLVDANVGLLLNGRLAEICAFEETNIGMQMSHTLKISLRTSQMEEWDPPKSFSFNHDRVGPRFFDKMRTFVSTVLKERFGV